MIVYWDLVALWNFILDYLLLCGTLRLAGRHIERRRIACAALLGAAFSAAQLLLPHAPWLTLAAFAAVCRAAFGRTKQALRLAILFAGLSCALGGAVVLLGQLSGGMERLARGIVYAQLPWGVFALAAGLSRLLLATVFRGEARCPPVSRRRVQIGRGGRSVTLTLLADTGNTLTDPLTGLGVPVICADALEDVLPKEGSAFTRLAYRTLGVPEGTLRAFCCDTLRIDGRELGPRLIAVTEDAPGNGCQGLWCGGEEKETEHVQTSAG